MEELSTTDCDSSSGCSHCCGDFRFLARDSLCWPRLVRCAPAPPSLFEYESSPQYDRCRFVGCHGFLGDVLFWPSPFLGPACSAASHRSATTGHERGEGLGAGSGPSTATGSPSSNVASGPAAQSKGSDGPTTKFDQRRWSDQHFGSRRAPASKIAEAEAAGSWCKGRRSESDRKRRSRRRRSGAINAAQITMADRGSC